MIWPAEGHRFYFGVCPRLLYSLDWPGGTRGLGFGFQHSWIMGVGCLVNVSRCGRLHCYITGPVFLLAGDYVVLAEFSLLPMDGGIFLLAVLGITTLACLAELPLREIQEG